MIRISMNLATALVALSLIACGGGSDAGTVGGGSGGTSGISAGFTPSGSGTEAVRMGQGSASGDLVTVRIDLADADNVYAAAFDVTFNTAAVQFVGDSVGTALETGGAPVDYTAAVTVPGRLVVSVSRNGPTAGATYSGTRPLISLTFRVRQNGQFPATFQNNALLDDSLAPVATGTWGGGNFVGN